MPEAVTIEDLTILNHEEKWIVAIDKGELKQGLFSFDTVTEAVDFMHGVEFNYIELNVKEGDDGDE